MRWIACGIIGLIALFFVAVIAEKLSAPAGTPPLPTATTTPVSTAPPPPPKPLTPEEQARLELEQMKQTAANQKLADQAARTKNWSDGTYLRLDQVEQEAGAILTRWTLFVPDSGSDLFYLNQKLSSLIAGPANLTLRTSDFPDLSKENQKKIMRHGYVIVERLKASARFRVARGRETNYTIRFARPEAVPDRLEVKVSVIRPTADAEWESLLQSSPLRGKPEDLGAIVSLAWDTKRHAEIVRIEEEIKKRETTSTTQKPKGETT